MATNFGLAPHFDIELFLLSALTDFSEIDEETRKTKSETVKEYATLLLKAKLTGEKTLKLLTRENLVLTGIPIGPAIAISNAAQSYGRQSFNPGM